MANIRTYICVLGLACFVFFSIAPLSNAQTIVIPTIEETIEATIRPKLPRAFQDVSISVVNYNTDFNQITISWFVNDVLISEGIGQTSFNFKTGRAGEEISVLMRATTNEGRLIERVYTFNPGEVDLIWEADSYVPPFYRGKKLHPTDGTIRIVAVPFLQNGSGTLLNASEIVYTWKVDNKARPELSGYGRQTITLTKEDTFKANLPISVEISAPNSTMVATNNMIVKTVRPVVHLYEFHPLYGMWLNNNIESGFDLTEEEIRVTAQPFFFGVTQPDHRTLDYRWSINGSKVDFTDDTRNTMTLRHVGGNGTSNIGVSIQHTDSLFQGGTGNGLIRFGGARNPLGF